MFFKRLFNRIWRRIRAVNWLRVLWETLKTAWWAVSGAVSLAVKAVVTVLLILLVAGALFATIFVMYIKTNLSTDLFLDLDDFTLNQTSVILYYDDEIGSWEKLADVQTTEDRTWIDYKDIPADLEHAVVAIEDKRFYKHNGVDWFRTFGAFANMFLSMSDTYGGSTLTQQLIKNLTEENSQTVQRKLKEIFKALEFEKNYTKQEIITWYLNEVYFGSGCYGIVAAADYYYGKEVSELSLAEIASIVGITNNPSIYSPFIDMEANKERQETILLEMYKQKYITQEEYEAAVAEELVLDYTIDDDEDEEDANEYANVYSWYTDAVIEDAIADLMELYDCSYDTAEDLLTKGGYRIYACIDPDIQDKVDLVYTDLSNFETDSNNQLQSAIVVTDPYTGDIVAMAGGVGEKTGSRLLNRATMSERPPGSSLKPLAVYSPAIEYGLITPDTRFDDDEDVRLSGSTWMPKNDSRSWSGVITVRTALRNSVNTVAAQILDQLSPQRSYDFLTQKLHFTTLVEQDGDISDIAYAPLSLGQLSYGVTVREMAAAYGIFDNMGVYIETRTYSRIEDSNGVVLIDNEPKTNVAISDTTAYWITDMLEDAVNSGTGRLARLNNMPVAGKTGTTSDNYDRWFVGYTPYYVAAVWSGYDYNERISYSGGNPSSLMWGKVMALVHEDLPYMDFPEPSSKYLSPVVGCDAETEYTIRCLTQTGVVLQEETDSKLAGKTITVKAPKIDGYSCMSDTSMKVKISSNPFDNVYEFVYVSTQPKDVAVTIQCYDIGGALITSVTASAKEDSKVTISAPAVEGYEVVPGSETVELLVSVDPADNIVKFVYDVAPEEDPEDDPEDDPEQDPDPAPDPAPDPTPEPEPEPEPENEPVADPEPVPDP